MGLTGHRAVALFICFRRIVKIDSRDFAAVHDQVERIAVMLRI